MDEIECFLYSTTELHFQLKRAMFNPFMFSLFKHFLEWGIQRAKQMKVICSIVTVLMVEEGEIPTYTVSITLIYDKGKFKKNI